MRGIAGIIDQLHRSVEGDSWHGPSIREILEGIAGSEAAARPIAGAHSIWELLHHVIAWTRAVHTRVLGNVCELEGEADWPPVHNTSDRAWADAVADLQRAHSELFATLRTLDDEDLDAGVPNREYDRAHLLQGVAQHHAYHAGQMSLLKRALQQGGGRDEAEVAAVRRVALAWTDAIERGDLGALGRLMTPDVVVVHGDGRVLSGRDQVLADLAASLQNWRVQQRVAFEETVVSGEWAFDRSRMTTTMSPANGGTATTTSSRTLTVLRRGAGGEWNVARTIGVVEQVR